MINQNNRIIYELEEEDDKGNAKSLKIDRKLGAVSYIKWGTLYNYAFSFDIRRGRLLCFKTANSSSYNNYYNLNKGDFFKDESEINKFEAQLQKKKNYKQLNEKANVIYVKTQKGRLFKLIIDEAENADKIIGYLQMCFQSKIQNVSAFFAFLGVGLVEISSNAFKLTTGIVVKLDDWSKKQNGNYLQANEPGFNLLISNVEILGGIIAGFYAIYDLVVIIFNPSGQTVDVILYGQNNQPQAIYFDLFKIVKSKKHRISPSKKGAFLKLNTDVQVTDDSHDYFEVGQNEAVKIFMKKQWVQVVDYALVQSGMYNAKYIDSEIEDTGDDAKTYVTGALEYYKKNYKRNQHDEDTKEFIIVNKQQRQLSSVFKSQTTPKKQQIVWADEELNIDDPCVQKTLSINVHMGIGRASIEKSQQNSDTEQVEMNYENKDMLDEIKDFQEVESQGQVSAKLIQNQIKEQAIEKSDDEDDINNMLQYSIIFDSNEHCEMRDQKSIMTYAQSFTSVPFKDEYRVANAHKSGGTQCVDKKMVELTRSVGTKMLKEMGQRLLSGNFNLTTVSFPINAMIPKSALEKTFMQTILFPLYLNKAAMSNNPIDRIKLTAVALLSNYIQANSFLKPLNPILGETFEGGFEDGTVLTCEQISHHPPISYFYVIGPKQSYKMYGYSLYEAKAGLNSLTILNNGTRYLQFNNQKLAINFSSEHYSGTFFGTMRHESQGTITITDEGNNLQCSIVLGKVKSKPTDYLKGEIKQGKTVLSSIYGSYMGFIEVDGIRYWDARAIKPFAMIIHKSSLESDHTKRTDRVIMLTGDMVKAQKEKERLEDIQRKDAALRKAHAKTLSGSIKKKK